MKILYPPIEPYKVHRLQADDLHTLYVEESGNPNGLPVVFLHGGPGGGCKPHHRSFFNPEKYRIIISDQRGAGRSTPAGETKQNNSDLLIEDLELIRDRLAVNSWLLYAGSWGATLALLYAQKFPEIILGLILRGSFLARQRDLDWFTQDGVSRIYPDYWQRLEAFVGGNKDVVSAIHQGLMSEDKQLQLQSAREWGLWGGAVALGAAFDPVLLENEPVSLSELNQAKIELHYAVNDYFIEENQILNNCDKISHLPTILVHGRNDLVCPLESAWELHERLPNSELNILSNAGHLADGEEMIDALVNATDEMLLKV
jgi:proline iminopeptidase